MVKDDNNKKKDNKSDADLKKQLELAQKKIEEHANDLKRLQAEFENHIKRTDKEKQQFSELANADLIKKLLPVVDEFEHALKQINDKGVEMIFNNLMKVLHDAGLKEIEAEGLADPF
ncbi:nucleotide exchange factor GrpE, partial [Candidatus Woesearchaeota archaeon]